jgi:acyl-CoA thioester hydrolase
MSEFRFFHPVEVRYGDLDPQGHLNNAKYLTYFETGRIQYLVQLGLFKPGNSFLNLGIIMADAQITYKAAVEYGTNVKVGVRIARIGNKSMTSEYVIVNADTGQELATGSSVLVAYDYRSNQTLPISDEWRRVIAAFEGLTTDEPR